MDGEGGDSHIDERRGAGSIGFESEAALVSDIGDAAGLRADEFQARERHDEELKRWV